VVTAEPSTQTPVAIRNNIGVATVVSHSFNGFLRHKKKLLRVLPLARELAH
jgi:hypothetical protein